VSPESIVQTVAAAVAPLITLIGLMSRRRRLLGEIRDNLSLLQEIQKDEVLSEHTPNGRIPVAGMSPWPGVVRPVTA
jgi:hypothetical protein